MNSFSEIARALYLKERYESLASQMPKDYPYKHLNTYTSGIVSFYMFPGNFELQCELGRIASEYNLIHCNVARAKDLAFNMGE